MSNNAARQATLHQLFYAHDLDGNGTVEVTEMQLVIQQSKKQIDGSGSGSSKGFLKPILRFEAQINQAMKSMRDLNLNQQSSGGGKKLSESSTIETQPGRALFANADGLPAMDRDVFTECLSDLTAGYSDEEFTTFCRNAMDAVATAKSAVEGSAKRKIVWAMFQNCDRSGDGLVDMDELEILLNVATRHDKKEVAKWRARLEQKHKEEMQAANASGSIAPPAEGGDNNSENKLPHGANACELTLSDFHSFIDDYTEGSEDRLREIATRMEEELKAKIAAYIEEKKLGEILHKVQDEVTRERPEDVLDGVIRAVKRVQGRGFLAEGEVNASPSSTAVAAEGDVVLSRRQSVVQQLGQALDTKS